MRPENEVIFKRSGIQIDLTNMETITFLLGGIEVSFTPSDLIILVQLLKSYKDDFERNCIDV